MASKDRIELENQQIAERLRARLVHAAPGYRWDLSNPPFHSSYDNWHIWGWKRSTGPQFTPGPASPASPISVRDIKSAAEDGESFSDSITPTSEDPSELLVVARISHHALRLEREFRLAERIGREAAKEYRDLYIKAIEFVKIPQRHPGDITLVAMICESPGPNYLFDMVELGPNFYRATIANLNPSSPWANIPARPQSHKTTLGSFMTFALGAVKCLEHLHHRADMVHGDLRGDAFHFNRQTGAVRLINFGSGARAFENGLTSAGWSSLTSQIGVEHKLQFIAPEQTGRTPAQPDSRTDIYSLGVLFWTMLADEPAFAGSKPLDIMQNVLSRRIPPIDSKRSDVPPIMSRIIQKMTQKNMSERYQSTIGLRHDIERCKQFFEDGDNEACKHFELGSKDFSTAFVHPPRLVGRKHELETIRKVITRAMMRVSQRSQIKGGATAVRLHGMSLDSSQNDAMMSESASTDSHDLENRLLARVESASPDPTRGNEDGRPDHLDADLSQGGRTGSDEMSRVASLDTSTPQATTSTLSSTKDSLLQTARKLRQQGTCELVGLAGEAGLGKSSMLQVIQVNARSRGYFASAKFDQAKKTPFEFAFKIMSGLFRQLFAESDVSTAFHEQLRSLIRPVWPDLHTALELPPWLMSDDVQKVKDSSQSGEDMLGKNPVRCGDAGNTASDWLHAGPVARDRRFIHTLLDFLRLLTMNKFVCVCLDDIHFADEESLDLIHTIASARIPMVMILTYRNDESVSGKIRALLKYATKIELRPFTEEQTTEYIRETLHRSSEYVMPLVAVVQEKSRGIPFYIREILDRLHKTKCIYYSWRTSNWEYNLDDIFDRLAESGDNRYSDGTSIVRRLDDLPQEAKSLLCWAGLIGSSFRYTLLNRVMVCDCSKASPMELLPPRTDDTVSALQSALSSFAIMATDEEDKFRFSHDRYMNAAAALRSDYNEKEMHYVLACALMKHEPWDKSLPTQHLFNQSRHVCAAIEVIRNRAASYKPFRQLLYEAAEVAREQGARAIALHFLKFSLALLGDDIWDTTSARADTTYTEVLTLVTQTAGSYWYQGDYASASKLAEEVFANAKEATDRSAAYMIQSRINAQTGNSSAAFQSMITALKDLGHVIKPSTWEECDEEFKRIAAILVDHEPDLTVDPATIDHQLVTVGAVMVELISASFWYDVLLFYQINLEFIKLYLSRGIFPHAALAYIHMGSIGLGRFDMVAFGLKMGNIAKDIMNHFPLEHYTNGRGWTMHALHLGHIETSIAQQLPSLQKAFESSVTAGDKILQTLNVGVTAAYRLWSSQEAPEIEAFIIDQDELLPGWRKDLRGGVLLTAVLQYVKALQGKTNYTSAAALMDDETHTSAEYVGFLHEASDHPTRLETIYNCYRLLALHKFGFYEEALVLGEILYPEVEGFLGMRYHFLPKFYYALCLIEKWRLQPDSPARQEALKIVHAVNRKLTAYHTANEENLASYCSVLQAGIAEMEGDPLACVPLFEAAVSHAFVHGIAMEEALANELYAEFLIRRGCSRPARSLIDDAIAAYRRIGCTGKIRHIEEKHAFMIHKTHATVSIDQGTQTTEMNTNNSPYRLSRNDEELASQTSEDRTKAWIAPATNAGSGAQSRGHGGPAHSDLSSVGLDMIDLATILESSQLLSSELDVDKLLRNLTEIIVSTTGAELGGVVVENEETGWSLAALRGPEGEIVDGIGQALQNIPDAVAQQVSLYCLRFRENLFIANIIEDERFAISKKYRRENPEGRAMIAMPVLHGGHHLLGCIYIEGPARSFTERNTAVLRLLVNQVAISLANATLFKRLEKASATNAAMLEMQKQALEQAREAERKAKAAESQAMEMVRLKEEAFKAKSMFLANVSHELRTPLNGVIGMSELLKASQLSREQEGYADSIRVCADTLLSVINDILDFSKLEAGKMQMFNVQLSLKETISEVVRALSYTNMERGLQTVEELEIDSSMLVMGDPVRLHQVFMNLLSNAYKFTAKGIVTVRAVIEREDETTYHVLCSVKDTGIGISEEQCKKLFLPFSQADSSTARSYGGTGLGLSICKAIIEIMKGRIWLTSEPGVGTTVSFTIPFAKVDRNAPTVNGNTKSADPMSIYRVPTNDKSAPTEDHAPGPSLSSIPRDQIRICIAEDNAINQKIAISFVQRLGFKCAAYNDGQAAVDALVAASAEGNPFHLVLMDCQMPVLDGYNATREIRKHPDPHVSGVLVIAMTASAIRGDREKCLEAGMNNYLAKPVRANVLKNMLEGYLSQADKEVDDLQGVTDGIAKAAIDGAKNA